MEVAMLQQSPILSRGRVGMTIQMEKSVTFAPGTLSKCLVTRSSLNGRISNRNACEAGSGKRKEQRAKRGQLTTDDPPRRINSGWRARLRPEDRSQRSEGWESQM